LGLTKRLQFYGDLRGQGGTVIDGGYTRPASVRLTDCIDPRPGWRGRRAAWLLAFAFATLTCAVFSPSAWAVPRAQYSGVSFGPDGTSSTSFTNLQSITVDQSTGTVYVYDATAESLYKFDAEGNPVNFSALGTNVIPGVGGAARTNPEFQVAVAPPGS